MLEKKCMESCKSLQRRNDFMRFTQVENQSRNHVLRKRTCCQCVLRTEIRCVVSTVYLQHPTTSYTGLMRPIFVNSHTKQYLTEILHYLTISTVTTLRN